MIVSAAGKKDNKTTYTRKSNEDTCYYSGVHAR